MTIQNGHSTVTLKASSKWKLDKELSGTISGLNYRSPLINHRARLHEKQKADQAMAAMEMEMIGMLGRIHVELKGEEIYQINVINISEIWFFNLWT